MLMPKRSKHRKMFRGRMKGKAIRGSYVAFGDSASRRLSQAWIDSRQIEAVTTRDDQLRASWW